MENKIPTNQDLYDELIEIQTHLNKVLKMVEYKLELDRYVDVCANGIRNYPAPTKPFRSVEFNILGDIIDES